MSRRPVYDSTCRQSRSNGWSLEARKRGFYRLKGLVETPQGFVDVIGLTSGRIPERDDPDNVSWKKWGPVTRLALIRGGRKHMRDIPRLLTRLGAVRAAAKFAREVPA